MTIIICKSFLLLVYSYFVHTSTCSNRLKQYRFFEDKSSLEVSQMNLVHVCFIINKLITIYIVKYLHSYFTKHLWHCRLSQTHTQWALVRHVFICVQNPPTVPMCQWMEQIVTSMPTTRMTSTRSKTRKDQLSYTELILQQVSTLPIIESP